MENMKAVFFMGKNHLDVHETEIPRIGSEEALIRVKYAGICGTDLSIVSGKHPRAKAPLIMGHEFSGEIHSVDSKRDDLKPGGRVVAEPLISCGTCFTCRSGNAYICQFLGLYGIDEPGAFAEYVKIPTDKIFGIPDNVDFDVAALIEPIAVAVHSVRLSGLKVGDTVCVQGAGPIGLLTAIVADLAGAKEVIICEKQPLRIKIAEKYGLTVLDANRVDPVAVVEDLTGGRGADIVFEVAGAAETILMSPNLCRVKGEIIQVAIPKVPREVDIVAITFKELTIKGVRVYAPFDFEKAIQIVSTSGIDFRPLLTPPFSLDMADEAFGKAAEGSNVMRVVFKI